MILANPAGMLLAGGDRKPVADQSHLNRAERARDVPQSERPVGTLTPTPQRAGLTDGTGMLNARADRAPIRGRAYPQRGGLTQRRAKPQFSLSIGPQHHSLCSESTPHAWYLPPETCAKSGADAAWPGKCLVPARRRPSCPVIFAPQHQAAPTELSAQTCSAPAITAFHATTPVDATSSGTKRLIIVPSPSSPRRLPPQHHSL